MSTMSHILDVNSLHVAVKFNFTWQSVNLTRYRLLHIETHEDMTGPYMVPSLLSV